MKFFLLLCLAIVCCATHAYAGETIRICTYHLLNYSMENEDGRTAQFKAIIEQIKPDILVVQDVVSQEAAFKFFTDALDPQAWSLSTFTDGPDTDNMVYFKFDKFAFLDAVHHPTALRNISEYSLFLKATGDTITVFSAHLTSGDSNADAAARDAESDVLRNRILGLVQESKTNIVACGNFNFYSTEEMGYIRLLLFDTSFLHDPMGGWVRNEEASAALYTQSTRTTADGACGGGVGGGLDDRFDLLLLSYPMLARYVDGSYKVYGNDGQPRLNKSINDPVNTAVTAELAAALRCASDHLPVYADVVFDTPTDVRETAISGLEVKVYPMPVTEQGSIEIFSPVAQQVVVTVSDVAGRCCASYNVAIEAGRRVFPLPVLPAGVYYCQLLGADGAEAVPFTVVR